MKDKLSKAKAKVKKPVNKLMRRPDESIESAKLPYITNDTIAEHREEVCRMPASLYCHCSTPSVG